MNIVASFPTNQSQAPGNAADELRMAVLGKVRAANAARKQYTPTKQCLIRGVRAIIWQYC